MKLFLKFILIGTICQFFVSGQQIRTFEEATDIIQSYVKSTGSTSDLCADNSCCSLSNTESCSISNFVRDTATMILPGGNTRCIYSDSTPFAFEVIPGEKDKLMIAFAGGGACWNELTSKLGFFCQPDSIPQTFTGLYDRANPNNRFKDFTVVHISYCSGDIHAGNVTRPYADSAGQPVVQVGLNNVQATLDWIQQQMKNGGLSSTLSELLVTGSSAGSLGAQIWSNYILENFPAKKAAVVPDSYAGYLPRGSVGELLKEYGFCESGLLSASLKKKCLLTTLTVTDMGLEYQAKHPTIPFSYAQSKTDIVQYAFWVAVAATLKIPPVFITPTEFYAGVSEIFGTYSQANSNFLAYLVDGSKHCFTPGTEYYTATTKGPKDTGARSTGLWLYEWYNQFPMSENDVASTRCEEGGEDAHRVNTYCAATVYPKSFTEHYN